jgi:hypothetical protein
MMQAITTQHYGPPTSHHLNFAAELLRSHGYRVSNSKPAKSKEAAPWLNCLGLPMSPSYDPNYKMKYHTPPLKRQQNVGPGISPERWAEMCSEARENLAGIVADPTTEPHADKATVERRVEQ